MSQVVMSRKEKNVPITGTIRTVDMLMKNKPRWNSVKSKMHYCVIFNVENKYRVFAQAKASIRQRQWERLFDAYGVMKLVPVRGFFEDYKPYRSMMSQAHTILEEFGPRPVRLAQQSELQVAHNRIRELENRIVDLEDEVTQLRGKQKRKAAEMSADEYEAEESVEGETEHTGQEGSVADECQHEDSVADVALEKSRPPHEMDTYRVHVMKPERELSQYEIWLKTRKPLKPMPQLS
jgi:uncharacterized small protein (DUF1192 family)